MTDQQPDTQAPVDKRTTAHKLVDHYRHHGFFASDRAVSNELLRLDEENAALRAELSRLQAAAETEDRVLRASVPDRWKGCTSAVGGAQSYIAELEGELSRLQAAGGQGVKPTAFVHWPLNGAPRLVWYSNDALHAAIRKAHEGPQCDVMLYAHPPAAPALVPLTDAQQRHAAIGQSLERAAKDLPHGYDLSVCIERGAGWATVSCPNLHNIAPTFDGDCTLAEQVDGCTDAAIRHATRNGLTVGGDGGE